jgi:hypothetical protein
MKVFTLPLGLMAAALLSTTPTLPAADLASAEPDSGNLRTFVELVRKDVKTEKAIILAQNLDFTKDQAVDFWPVYSEYELDLGKWYDKRLSLMRDYLARGATLTDDQARKLADEVFTLEEKRTELKRKYFRKFSKVVGAKMTARFFQIENQLNAAIDLRLAAAMPLIK